MAGSIAPNYMLPPDAPRAMLMDGCVGGAGGEGEGARDAAPAVVAELFGLASYILPQDFTHLPFPHHCRNDTACSAEELPWTTRAAKPFPSLDFGSPLVLASEGLLAAWALLHFIKNISDSDLRCDWRRDGKLGDAAPGKEARHTPQKSQGRRGGGSGDVQALVLHTA